MLIVVVVAAIAQRTLHSRQVDSDPLHGDSETASGALADLLAKTPAAQRAPMLLSDVQAPYPGLRYAAVDALGDIHTPQAADAVERAYTDSSSVVRQRALETLLKIDAKRGLHLLLAGLHDEDSWIREAAVTQLKLFLRQRPKDARDAVPSLISATADADTDVSAMAIDILCKITDKPWRVKHDTPPAQRQAVVEQWQTWWTQERPHWNVPAEYAAVAPIQPTRADPAPDFSVQDIDGKTISLSGQRGRVTLLNFWGTWCPPCKVEMPDLVKLDQTFRGQKLDIIGLALNEDGADSLRQWCKTNGVAYRQALSTEAIQNAYGHVEEVPVSVLIDAQGRVRYRWEGERDYNTFRAAVERLLHETPTQAG
jgi:peroxiredoxin